MEMGKITQAWDVRFIDDKVHMHPALVILYILGILQVAKSLVFS